MPDVPVPTLIQTWLESPSVPGPYVGERPTMSGAASPDGPPTEMEFRVCPGSIREAEDKILAQTDFQIQEYDDLRQYVASTTGWIFTVHDETILQPHYHPVKPNAPGKGGSELSDGRPGGTWADVDPRPELTAQMTTAQHSLLLRIADTIEMAGRYVAALNNSTQQYAEADKDSFLPPPGQSIGRQPNGG